MSSPASPYAHNTFIAAPPIQPSPITHQQDNLRAVLPLPLHTTALKPSSLSSIFSALSTLDISSIPALPPLAPTLDSLRKELAIRRGDQLESEPDSANRDGVSGSAPGNEVQSESLKRTEDEEKTTQMQAELDTEMLYMAIVATDSTVVYYKLTKGIKKPADIPDE